MSYSFDADGWDLFNAPFGAASYGQPLLHQDSRQNGHNKSRQKLCSVAIR